MDNIKQDMDKTDRLLDALDDPQIKDEELERMLSDPDCARDMRLLEDCRSYFVRELLETDSDKAWGKFARKQRVKRHRRLLVGFVSGAASILLLLWVFRFTFQPSVQREFVTFLPDTSFSNVVLCTGDGRKVVLSNSKTDSLPGNIMVVSDSGKMLVYEPVEPDSEMEMHTLSTSSGCFYQLCLSDGTRVWLNAESRLRYPSVFPEGERVVELQGEGFFKVAHDASRPFKVKVGDLVTEVLGTEFNVRAYSIEDTHVTLLQGSVRVTDKVSAAEAVIRPGEDAFLREDGSFEIKNVDTDSFYLWIEGYFYFDNESLAEIMRELCRWYGVRVVFRDETFMHLRLHFLAERDLPVDNALKLLNMMGDMKITREGNTIFVD
ncbi:FecR family protein [uncultured Butyricimonas sp.]|uniref:FecR family protein n=1 Tax=uncultured Butyricimonas sp. TaxID=1268785 RepID=UPI0026DAA1D9|nr:FecR domain-containing protein [uncultured Butyricimonas sp.]